MSELDKPILDDERKPSFVEMIERMEADHERRVIELLAANNREVERRRAAVAALRRVRQRITGTIVDGSHSGKPWIIEVADGQSMPLSEFLDAAIAAAAQANG